MDWTLRKAIRREIEYNDIVLPGEVQENGVVRVVANVKRGRPLKKGEVPANLIKHQFTKESAALARANQKEKARIKAEEGLQRAAEKEAAKMIERGEVSKKITCGLDAWSLAIEKISDVYFNSRSLKSMSDAARVIGSATGMMREVGDKQEAESTPMIGAEEARNIIQIFNYYGENKPEPDIIDAEVS